MAEVTMFHMKSPTCASPPRFGGAFLAAEKSDAGRDLVQLWQPGDHKSGEHGGRFAALNPNSLIVTGDTRPAERHDNMCRKFVVIGSGHWHLGASRFGSSIRLMYVLAQLRDLAPSWTTRQLSAQADISC